MTLLDIKIAAARRSAAWQLALDKFPMPQGGTSLPDKKLDALKPLIIPQGKRRELWQAVIQRKLAFLDDLKSQHGDRLLTLELVNSSRLLLHLGRASVLENVGLYADRTTGLPLIPGSAVKGVVSTWACWDANPEAIYSPDADGKITLVTDRSSFSNDDARRVFGDNSDNSSSGAGDIFFLSAVPTTPPVLVLDIVNPHHDESENVRTGQLASSDKQNLQPNPFLAIEAEATTWRFSFLARAGLAGADRLLAQTSAWLVGALTQAGLGAKTAAGYGRFRRPSDSLAVVTPPPKPLTEEEKSADLIAAIKNSFRWKYDLKPHVEGFREAGNTAALEQLKSLAASNLDKLKLAELRRQSWFPQ